MMDGDVATLERLLDDNVIYIHAPGTMDGKKSYLEYVRSGTVHYKEFRRGDVQIQVFDQTAALVFSRISISLELRGEHKELNSLCTAVWIRRNGKAWRLVCWQATPTRP